MLDKLPPEILLLVAEHIDDYRTLNALARTSTPFYNIVDVVLYRRNVAAGASALRWALERSMKNTITKALDAGFDVDSIPNDESLLMAAVSSKNLEIAKFLLTQHKANPNISNSVNESALNFAGLESPGCFWGPRGHGLRCNHIQIRLSPKQLEMTELLLQHGADALRLDGHRKSVLYKAVYNRDIQLMQLLLRFLADKGALGDAGTASLCLAMCFEETDNTFDLQFARLLLAHGTSANCHRGSYQTPIGWAAFHGNTPGLELLLKYGVDLNVANGEGNTPLQVAILMKKYEFALAILKAGAFTEINQSHLPKYRRSPLGTPLQMSVDARNPELCRAILERDTNTNVRRVFTNLSFEHYDLPQPTQMLAMKGLKAKKVKAFMLAEFAKRKKKAAKREEAAKVEKKANKANKPQEIQSSNLSLCQSFNSSMHL